MIAGIDVNERDIVIAYFSNNGKPKFERIKRLNDKEVLFFLLNKLRINKIDEVAIENPRGTSKLCPKCNRKLKKLGSYINKDIFQELKYIMNLYMHIEMLEKEYLEH
jgi:transposase